MAVCGFREGGMQKHLGETAVSACAYCASDKRQWGILGAGQVVFQITGLGLGTWRRCCTCGATSSLESESPIGAIKPTCEPAS